ncbi:helix-turn-helix domain-containing protein [Streptomyces scabiei]|uniref:helix-turn-helix domain-containing protein n=1 Tax=Streptomyces scabiei TaxID=1930 RepID=UPI0038F66C16
MLICVLCVGWSLLLLKDTTTCISDVAKEYGVSRTTIYKHCGVVNPIRSHEV